MTAQQTSRNSPLGSQPPSVQPVAWSLLLIPAALQFCLHVFTNGRFGIFRDEYYYLACAAHPAWGYVDQPPLSIWLLGLWKSVFGDSVNSIRILPAVCTSGLVLLTGATAAELGGRRWAQLLAGLAVAIGGTELVVGGYYSMNCLDFLAWLGAYYLLIRILRTGSGRWWPWLGLVVGLGLFNKIGLVVFGLALVIGLAVTENRRHFRDRRLYLAGAIAAAFLVPYLLWNATHGWATLEFIRNAKSGKIASFTPIAYLAENALEANPFTAALWAGGLGWLLFARRVRRYRMLAWMFLATYVILVLQKSKPYYFATSFPLLLAAGGVAWESWTNARHWQWVRWLWLVLLIGGGAVIAPIVVPLLSPRDTVNYGQRMHLVPAAQEVGHETALPQHLADRLGWENLARIVSEIYRDLPPEERDHCVAFGQNYGEAGALQYWSRRYDMPSVYSTHNNYWFWGPPPADTRLMIVVGGSREDLESVFDEVTEAGVAHTSYAVESRRSIWVCRGLKSPIDEVWNRNKTFD